MSKLHAGICYDPTCYRLLALQIKSPTNYKSAVYHASKSDVKQILKHMNQRLQSLVISKRNKTAEEVKNIDNGISELLKRKEHLLKVVSHQQNKHEELDIEKAKAVPVTDILELDGQWNAHCPWHNEKTPSLHYYKNTNSVYCFGCKKYGSVIDIVMAQQDKDFISAVNYLLNL